MPDKTPSMGETAQEMRPPRDDLYRSLMPGVELRDAEDGSGPTLFGHFAVFNRWTEISSFFEGNFLERIAPGAFRKTFREQEPRLLFQHGRSDIGDMPIGSVDVLREDETGAYYEAALFENIPPLLMEGLRAGTYGASFRFRVMREEFKQDPGTSPDNPKGLPERTLKEVQVMEFGPVTFPAYPDATAGVRSITDLMTFERLARDETALAQLIEFRNGAAAEPHADDEPPTPDEAREDDEPAEERAEQEPQDPQDDAPPTVSAGAELHPDTGRRVPTPRYRGSLGRSPAGYLPPRRSASS